MGRTGLGPDLENYKQRLVLTFYITVQNFITIGQTVFALWGKYKIVTWAAPARARYLKTL